MVFHAQKAIVLAIRTFVMTLFGSQTASAAAIHSLSGFGAIGVSWLISLYVAGVSGVFTLLLNLLEDNTTLNLGTKGFTVSDATRKA
jgi:hypothetical protein